MESFWYTKETVPEGVGMGKFTPAHFAWFITGLLACVIFMLIYSRFSEKAKNAALKTAAVLLIADELFKWAGLMYTDNLRVNYLPLHLCSINIFVCAAYAWKKNDTLAELLHFVCMPAALLALVFPSWSALPVVNFMALHSITVHFLLFLFPHMVFADGYRPDVRLLPKCLIYLLGAGVIMFFVNKLLGTNFMFLNWAEPGTPLVLFEKLFGTPGYILGIPILLAVLWFLMYLPWLIGGKTRKEEKTEEN